MSEVSNNTRASEVLEKRKNILKKIEERENKEKEHEKEVLENLINLILNVFEASDEDTDPNTLPILLVWKVLIMMDEEKKITCSVAFSKKEPCEYYGIRSSETLVNLKNMKKLLDAIRMVDAVETTRKVFDGVYDYFVQTPGYFASQQCGVITISMAEHESETAEPEVKEEEIIAKSCEVSKARDKKLEDIVENKKLTEEKLKKYTKQVVLGILKIFEASNNEENSEFPIWQVCVKSDGEKLECSVAFSRDADKSEFYYITDPNIKKLKAVEMEMEKIQDIAPVTEKVIDNVATYFKDYISNEDYSVYCKNSILTVTMN